MQKLIFTAAVLAALTLMTLAALGWAPQAHAPGDAKLDDCRCQRVESHTGAKEIRERKSGDLIWHNKGEDAPY